MACGCADGTTVWPMVIFKGAKEGQDWWKSNVARCTFAHSPNGWTDNELMLWWLEHNFDADTHDKANDRCRVLLLDGHRSHLTLELILYAWAANITILCYPPHTTHILQGLDVVSCTQLKQMYSQEVKAFEECTGWAVGEG